MNEIVVLHAPGRQELDALGVSGWPLWRRGVSEFPWTYGEREICYFLEGEVTVVPLGGTPVTMGKGDLVTFPPGMACTWHVSRPVRKRYRFGGSLPAAGATAER
jgi:uncharacterized cupin superfamily protein